MGVDSDHKENNKKRRLNETAKAGKAGYADVMLSKNGHLTILDDEKCIKRVVHHDGQYAETSPGDKEELGSHKELIGRHNRTAEGTTASTVGNDDRVTTGGSAARDGKGGAHHHTEGSTTRAVKGSHIGIDNNSARITTAEAYNLAERSASSMEGSDGYDHENVAGDAVKYIKGTKYEQIGGECGVYIPAGNMDTQLDNGKCRTYVAGDILYESTTKITLKVGGSTIVIEPNKITLKSAGDILLEASGGITTKSNDGTTIDLEQVGPTTAKFTGAGV